MFKFSIGAIHGVWIYGDLSDDFSNRGETVTWFQMTCGDCFLHLLNKLSIWRNSPMRIETKSDAGFAYHVLVY